MAGILGQQSPISDAGYGKSEGYTAFKQRCLYGVLQSHIAYCGALMDTRSTSGVYSYFDLYGGPGIDNDFSFTGADQFGSPLQAVDTLYSCHVPYAAYVCETNRDRHARLVDSLELFRYVNQSRADTLSSFYYTTTRERCPYDTVSIDMVRGRAVVARAPCETAMPAMVDQALHRAKDGGSLGLIYADPNGIPPLKLLSDMASAMPDVDVLVNFSATALKRNRSSVNGQWDMRELIGVINRTTCFIRQPVGKWQWTMLFFSNRDMPLPRGNRVDFRDVKSDVGRGWFDKANYNTYMRGELRMVNGRSDVATWG